MLQGPVGPTMENHFPKSFIGVERNTSVFGMVKRIGAFKDAQPPPVMGVN